jgi:alkaline phosphatase D
MLAGMSTHDALTRRAFVAGAAGAGAAAISAGSPLGAFAARRAKDPFVTRGAFDLGVAAGLPGRHSITLWTHLDDVDRNSRIRLEVATDPGFAHLVQARDVHVAKVRDFTARTQIKGLKAGEQYFYRFHTKHVDSTVGRFRTLRPADSRETVRIGFFSCQDYQAGYYGSHASLAQEDDLDLVVCLGDYIYEQTYYPGPADRKDTSSARHDAFAITQPDFRSKYRLYKADKDLQAMHAAHPFLATWDDHEVEDNYAGSHRDPAKADAQPFRFEDRRLAGYRTFFEYMPRVRASSIDTQVYGSVRLSKMAEFFLLDERQYRDIQPCDDALIVPPCLDTKKPRSFLGSAQKQFFKDGVTQSSSTWKIVGNPLMIMGLDSAPSVAVNVDGWDGYAAERSEVLEHFADKRVQNLSFLTGDIHTFFAGQVTTTGDLTGTPIGTEFVGGSITSLGFENQFPGATVDVIGAGLRVTNPHLTFVDLHRRGFGIAEASADQLKVTYKGPLDATVRNSPVTTIASFKVDAGSNRVDQLAG